MIDVKKIDGDFVEDYFRKEYVIDNYNKFSGDEEIKKDLNNGLLSEKIENINKIFKWFKDKDGNNRVVKNEDLRKKGVFKRRSRLNFMDLLLRHNALVGGHPGPREKADEHSSTR